MHRTRCESILTGSQVSLTLLGMAPGSGACSTVGMPGTVQSPTSISGDRRGAGAMGPTALPILWAQATGSSPGPVSLAPLALRRWFGA